MSILEEKIKKNKESFDVNEPSAGHFDRFNQKIGYSQEDQKRKIAFGIAWKAAAVFLLLFAVSFLLPDQSVNGSRELASQVMTQDNYLEELENIKNYYGYQAEQKLEKISDMACNNEDCAELKEFARAEIIQLEKNTQELEEDFRENDQDSRVYLALVTNYRLMSNVLDQVIEKIDSMNN